MISSSSWKQAKNGNYMRKPWQVIRNDDGTWRLRSVYGYKIPAGLKLVFPSAELAMQWADEYDERTR